MANVIASINQPSDLPHPDIVWIPGGIFMIGSDAHNAAGAKATRLRITLPGEDMSRLNSSVLPACCRSRSATFNVLRNLVRSNRRKQVFGLQPGSCERTPSKNPNFEANSLLGLEFSSCLRRISSFVARIFDVGLLGLVAR